MEEKLKIFFCEDDENLGMLLREYLQAKGYVLTSSPMEKPVTKVSPKANMTFAYLT